MPETRLLFQHIDEPELAGIETYKRLGGYRALEKAYKQMEPDEVLQRARGLGAARPRRRRLLDGKEGLVPAARRHGEVPVLQRRRVRAGDVQGPRADVQEPASADRGDRDRGARRRRRRAPSSSSAASTPRSPTSSTRAVAEAYEAGYLGDNVLGTRRPRRARRPPRRRRLHLRRGDGAARLARGQARQPAAEAPVPRDPGPLRRPDADQQRRDALQRPPHRRTTAPSGSRSFGTEQSPGTKVTSISGCVQRPGNYEIELGIPAREIVYDLAGGPPEGREVKAWFPGGSSAPGPRPRGARPALLVRGDGRRRARCSARARSSSPTRPSRSRSWRCERRASTTTSRAASAPPAARARTGP